MCFSATASMAASGALAATGILALYKSQTTPQRLFAGIILIFSFQQLCEGVLWLSLTDQHYHGWEHFATHAFLICAQVIWPVWVPASIMLLETNPKRKKMLAFLTVCGVTLSAYLAYRLTFHNVYAVINEKHIQYVFDLEPPMNWSSATVYFIPTVLPALISSVRRMRLMGVIVLASYIIANVFYQNYLVSVWCFFAALISAVIFTIIIAMRNDNKASEELSLSSR